MTIRRVNPNPPVTLAVALARIADLQSRLAAHGLALRQPPPPPTTCCGRGCNGCVWEGYHDAMAFWVEDAYALLESLEK